MFLNLLLVCFSVPAKIVNISKNVSVNEGENVNLYCLAVGRPEPTVIWKHQKCKQPLHVWLSSDPEISCSQLHLYLSIFTFTPSPVRAFILSRSRWQLISIQLMSMSLSPIPVSSFLNPAVKSVPI